MFEVDLLIWPDPPYAHNGKFISFNVGALNSGRLICMQWPAVTFFLNNPEGLGVVDRVSQS